MDSADQTLLAKARQGDPRAFEALIKKHEGKIFNLILRMTGNRTETADLFQETFINAWKNLGRFRGDSDFSTWLYRIAVNAVLMKRRKKKVPAVSMDAPIQTEEGEAPREFGDWSTNPLASLENQELRHRMEDALNALSEKYKTVLILSDLQGLPNEEIGKILGISLASVKSRLHRARLFMRERLSRYFENN